MENLEAKLGYEFKNKKLLQQALTHCSCTGSVSKNYERLEFLGDRVLGVAMAHLLYNLFPNEPEGALSARFTKLVRKEAVAQIALELGLDKYIKAEPKSLCTNENVLCDVGEAVTGAICIEAGFTTAIEFVDRHWRHLINRSSAPQKDNKTALQELAHQVQVGAPVYKLLRKEGSEHEPYFYIEVSVEGGGNAVGSGKNKKLAEQDAAAKLIAILEHKNG